MPNSEHTFSAYVHVPYCRVRCGYCDFNTYTASELGGASRDTYADDVLAEMDLAKRHLSQLGYPDRPLSTVFFGGGTPTLLPAAQLIDMLDGLRERWGFVTGVEVTTEANPDSVDRAYLEELASSGFTRVSVGMQSAVPHVLKTLERTHRPEGIPGVISAAKDAGLQTSLDLIYGTPGETLEDWRHTIEVALRNEPDHISAYALIVEPGTKLARQIRRGEVQPVDDDLHADMYELANELFADAGYDWYEISNWSRGPGTQAQHNLAYWRGADWWGFGPGAHSHIEGTRWWNVKHPAAYTERLRRKESPEHDREVLNDQDQRIEAVMLRARLAEGVSLTLLDEVGRKAVAGLIADGLIDPKEAFAGTIVPTLRGRLLSDTLVHRLLGHSQSSRV